MTVEWPLRGCSGGCADLVTVRDIPPNGSLYNAQPKADAARMTLSLWVGSRAQYFLLEWEPYPPTCFG